MAKVWRRSWKRIVGQPGLAQQRLEDEGRDVAAPERLAGRVGEDQVVAGQPATGRRHHLRLSVAVRAQDVEGRVGQLDRALAARGLGLTQPPPPVEADEGVADEGAAGRPVDVAPAQPEQLALAHPGRDRQREQGLERMAVRLGEEAPGLVGAERPQLRAAPPRQCGTGRRVAFDEPPGDRLVEGAVEDGVGVAE